MDDPTTNWKFYDKLVEEVDPGMPGLMNVGSSGLHFVHGAFKYGATKTGLNLDSLQRSLPWFFADSPARREDY